MKKVALFQNMTVWMLLLARTLTVFGWRAHFMNVSPDLKPLFLKWGKDRFGVSPVDFENVTSVDPTSLYVDTKGILDAAVRRIYGDVNLEIFGALFPGVTDLNTKLRLIIKSRFLHQYLKTQPALLWFESSGEKGIVFTSTSELSSEYKHLSNSGVRVISFMRFAQALRSFRLARRLLVRLVSRSVTWLGGLFARDVIVDKTQHTDAHQSEALVQDAQVLFFPHKGTTFGSLFQKNHFYSEDPLSPFYLSNIQHIELEEMPSSKTLPGEASIQTFQPINERIYLGALKSFLIFLWQDRREIWKSTEVGCIRWLGILNVFRAYILFHYYLDQLSSYPKATIALAGYDIMVPVSLSMAAEAKKIKFVSFQERYIWPFCDLVFQMSDYLCASSFIVKSFEERGLISIDHFEEVGLLRSDFLIQYKNLPMPEQIEAITNHKKLIVALDYSSVSNPLENKVQPICNWQANRLFIEDMIALAEEMPEAHIIIRGKNDDWIRIKAFQDLVQRIVGLDNISVDSTYDEWNFSYVLCAHADLVIAKHTSLGAECMACDIPVLFYDYQHNCTKLFAGVFDYLGANVFVSNFADLRAGAKDIIQGGRAKQDIEENKRMDQLFGNLNDGRVGERARLYLERRVR